MPTYEMPMLLRTMTRPELVSALKRTAEIIFDKGGIIRQIDNLGTRELPAKISVHGGVHWRASHFVIKFVVPPKAVRVIQEEYSRDIDILRTRLFKLPEEEEEIPFECTLHEESLPPSYRKEVQEMLEIAKKKQKPKFNMNSGLNYYPFQK